MRKGSEEGENGEGENGEGWKEKRGTVEVMRKGGREEEKEGEKKCGE